MTMIKTTTVFIAGCLAAMALAAAPAGGESLTETKTASGVVVASAAGSIGSPSVNAPAGVNADLVLEGEALGCESLGRIAGGARQVTPPDTAQRLQATIKLWDEGLVKQTTTVEQGTGQIITNVSVQQIRQ